MSHVRFLVHTNCHVLFTSPGLKDKDHKLHAKYLFPNYDFFVILPIGGPKVPFC